MVDVSRPVVLSSWKGWGPSFSSVRGVVTETWFWLLEGRTPTDPYGTRSITTHEETGRLGKDGTPNVTSGRAVDTPTRGRRTPPHTAAIVATPTADVGTHSGSGPPGLRTCRPPTLSPGRDLWSTPRNPGKISVSSHMGPVEHGGWGQGRRGQSRVYN